MTKLSVSDDIVPVGEFKTSISKYLKTLNDTGHPLIITQNGRPAGVLVTPNEYDNLVYKDQFVSSVNRGLKDIESNDSYTTEQIEKELKSVRKSKVKQ